MDGIAARVRAAAVQGRDGQHGRRPCVDPDRPQVAEQPIRSGIAQPQDGGIACRIRDRPAAAAVRQGRAARIVEVGRIVAHFHRVRKRQVPARAGALVVPGQPLAPVHPERDRRQASCRDDHILVKGDRNEDGRAGAVRAAPVRRRDGHGARGDRIGYDALRAAKRAVGPGLGQPEVDRIPYIVGYGAARRQGPGVRVFQAGGRAGGIAGQHRIVEGQHVRAAAGQVRRGPIEAVERQQERRWIHRILHDDAPVEFGRYVDRRAGGVRAVFHWRGHGGNGHRREPDELDGVVGLRGCQRVRAPAGREHGDSPGAVEGVEPARIPVPGGSHGRERPVAVDADQLNPVVRIRGHKGVRPAAHREHGRVRGAAKGVEPAGPVGCRSRGGKGAVREDVDELHAVAGERRHKGPGAADHVEDGGPCGGAEHVEPATTGGAVRGRAVGLDGAVREDAHELYAVGVVRGHEGARVGSGRGGDGGRRAGVDRVDGARAGKPQLAPVRGRAVVCEGAVREDVQKLQAAGGRVRRH